MLGSIKGALLFGLLVSILIVAGAITASNYRAAHNEVTQLYDAELAKMSRILRGLLDDSLEARRASLMQALIDEGWRNRPDVSSASEYGHRYEGKLVFQVLGPDGDLLLRSGGAPPDPGFCNKPGYAYTVNGGYVWRCFALRVQETGRLYVTAEREDVRVELINKIAFKSVRNQLYGIPVMILVIWVVLTLGLKPLNQLAQSIHERDRGRLDPIPVKSISKELRPITEEINSLLHRLDRAFEKESRLVADTAHELRTPLSIIRLHAQNALAANDDESRERALKALMEGVDRTTRTAEQVLVLSRLETDIEQSQHTEVDLVPIARNLITTVAPVAHQKNQEISLDAPDQFMVQGNAKDIEILLRNLIDNAIRYTERNGHIEVRQKETAEGMVLEVCDNGPGIAAEHRPYILERFYRPPGQDGLGSGLGLSIVAHVVKSHGLKLDLLNNPEGRGLLVKVVFPKNRQKA